MITAVLMVLCTVAVAQGSNLAMYATMDAYEAATGSKIGSFQEAPQLQALVQQGKLPPLEERLPADPLVVVPRDEVGVYGGELVLASLTPTTQFDSHPSRFQS